MTGLLPILNSFVLLNYQYGVHDVPGGLKHSSDYCPKQYAEAATYCKLSHIVHWRS